MVRARARPALIGKAKNKKRDQVRKNRKKWKRKGRIELRNVINTGSSVCKLKVELWRAGARG